MFEGIRFQQGESAQANVPIGGGAVAVSALIVLYLFGSKIADVLLQKGVTVTYYKGREFSGRVPEGSELKPMK